MDFCDAIITIIKLKTSFNIESVSVDSTLF